MNINQIDLHHLRCLVVLAEELHFGRAADRLLMSQPPLTRLVADMEKALGAKLFARTTRRVALTPIGEVFVAEAKWVLSQFDQALQSVTAAVERLNGRLRLAYTPFALQTALPRILTTFRERDHDAQIDLMEMTGAAQSEALASGRIDLAFSDAPIQGLESETVLLHQEVLSLLVPEGHALATRRSVSLKELDGETLILHPRHEYPEHYDRLLAACSAAGAAPNIIHRTSGQNCMALAISGAGLLFSSTSWERFQVPGFVCLDIETPIYAQVWAAWVQRQSPARVETLVEIVRAEGSVFSASL